MKAIPRNRAVWRQACADALTVLARDARFDRAHLGALGFSLGGHFALSLGMAPPPGAALTGVADFLGPTYGLETQWSQMPPLLIQHGKDDDLVPMAQSAALVANLSGAGKKEGPDYIYTTYSSQGHGFNGAALTKSRNATLEFFKSRL